MRHIPHMDEVKDEFCFWKILNGILIVGIIVTGFIVIGFVIGYEYASTHL